MLCKQDATALSSYMQLITDHLDEPLTDAPERKLEAVLLDAIKDYLDIQSDASIAAAEQGLLLLMIPQELTYILDRVLARCLRDFGTELPFNLQLNDGDDPESELALAPREPTEESVKKIVDWVEQSIPKVDISDKPFFDRLLLLLRSWLRQKSFEKAANEFHRKATKHYDDAPSL